MSCDTSYTDEEQDISYNMENFRSTEEALLVTNHFLAYCCSLFLVLLPFKTDFKRPIFNYDFSFFGINSEKVTFVCVCVCVKFSAAKTVSYQEKKQSTKGYFLKPKIIKFYKQPAKHI